MRTALLSMLACAALASGCGYNVQVYAPGDKPGAAPSGSVTGLKAWVKDAEKVELVLVHGMGDHCSGYALGDANGEQGWLGNDAQSALGLVPVSTVSVDTVITMAQLGVGDSKQPAVKLRTREFNLVLDKSYVPVRATEITWSYTTQTLKNRQLAYDRAPGKWDQSEISYPPCVEKTEFKKDTFEAPARNQINRTLKGTLLNRNFADAVLYAGRYGVLVRRAMAESLCHMVRSSMTEGPCTWPQSGQLPDRTRFVFVTQSLGSRVLFDTMRALSPNADDHWLDLPKNSQFRKDAWPVMEKVFSQTPGVYMMANQIPLLGLSAVPPRAPGDQPIDFAPMVPLSASGDSKAAPPLPRSILQDEKIQFVDDAAALDPLLALAKSRDAVLQVVTFNDTNDLLSWHLPPWYQTAIQKSKDVKINAVNVFVENTRGILGVVAHPLPAHANYVQNGQVWDVIRCGAANGRAMPCDPPRLEKNPAPERIHEPR